MPIDFNLLKTLSGHGYDVNTVAFSRDGQWLASGGGDRSIRLWNVNSQQEVFAMDHGEWVNGVSFAPHGQFLASGARNGSLKIWSTENGQLLGTIQAHSQSANSVVFSPDSIRLVSGGSEGGIRVANLQNKSMERTIEAHSGWVWSVGFSSLGDRLVSAGSDQLVRIWQVDDGRMLASLEGSPDDALYATFSPDDRFVAGSCKDGSVRLWLADYGQQVFAFDAHEGAVNTVSFSSDGLHLVTAGADKVVRVWLVESGKLVRELTGHQDYVATATFSSDGKLMASCGGDGTVKIWQVTDRSAYSASGNGVEVEHQDATPRGATAYGSMYVAGKVIVDAELQNGPKVSFVQSSGEKLSLAVGDPPRTAVTVRGSELTVHSAEGIPLLTLDLDSFSVIYDKTEGASAPWSEVQPEAEDVAGFGRPAPERADGVAALGAQIELERAGDASMRYQAFESRGEVLARERFGGGRICRLVRGDTNTLYLLFDDRDEPNIVIRGGALDVKDGRAKSVFRLNLRTLEPIVSRRVGAADGLAGEPPVAVKQDPLLVYGLDEVMETVGSELRLHRILSKAVWAGASDIHVPSGAPIQIRRHGRLQQLGDRNYRPDEIESLLLEALSDEQRAHFVETNDLDFSYEISGVGRFRANVCRQHRGVDGTFRVIPDTIPAFDSIGLPESVRAMTKHHQGLVLVTGPAGQGKSTTIAALVDMINDDKPHHILTVEDPIEFVYPIRRAVVNQREVGRHTKSFANALRAALREDPDVIVVGEMRDLETISLAITAAETGHLVFGTLMTISAAQTVDRILDSFPAAQQAQIRTMLSESLKGIVSQQLIPLADGDGRALAAEVLVGTPAVANMIRERKTFQIPTVMQTGRNIGMQRMDDSLIDLVQSGRITVDSATIYAQDPKNIEGRLKPKASAEPAPPASGFGPSIRR